MGRRGPHTHPSLPTQPLPATLTHCPPTPTPPHQANKNVLVKGQVSLQGASAAAVFKSWWQPAFTMAGAASVDWASGRTRYGLYAAVETFTNIRWVGGWAAGVGWAVGSELGCCGWRAHAPTPARPAASPAATSGRARRRR